jgi:hypothetical protein
VHVIRGAIATGLLVAFGATAAVASDRRISADQLKIKIDGAKSQIIFKSTDPNLLFPGPGDDPVTNGATVEIVPATTPAISFVIPAGAGKPGWTAQTTSTPLYKFSNALAPAGISVVKTAALKQGRYLKFKAHQGLALTGLTLRAIAVRITIGSTRNCALYGPVGVRTSGGKTYLIAKKVPAPEPTGGDCSDASLGLPDCELATAPACEGHCVGNGICIDGGSGCMCAPPCGSTHPVCDGVCPAGEQCFAGAAVGACACLPAGSTSCGATGIPTCGGDCIAGQWCRDIVGECGCVDDAVCNCPSGFACLPGLHNFYSCAPETCGGTYPTCGGSCGDGGVCRPAVVSGVNGDETACVCATPGDCDTTCGGMDCPSGEVCHVTPNVIGACGCGAP